MSKSYSIKIGFIIGFFTILSIVIAQQSKIELDFIGYGTTYRENIVSFTNMGEVNIEGLTIYLDGQEFKEIDLVLMPGYGIQHNFLLEQGEHLIEARTPEGAYGSITVTAKAGEVPLPIDIEEKETESNLPKLIEDNILAILAIFFMIILIFIWSVKRK